MTQNLSAGELARRLAHRAEAVCRHYLRAGHKQGNYWLIGDAFGTPGRSLYVRLTGPDSGKGAAGKWTDAAENLHGDLLDLIALNRGLTSVRDAKNEARAFLSLAPLEAPSPPPQFSPPSTRTTPESARRLFAISRPIGGTQAAIYLRHRGIDVGIAEVTPLRFYPRCYYRDGDNAPLRTFPAMIAAVTDRDGRLTGVHRTWLDPDDAREKAPVASPRRAMGHLLGSGVRFGFDGSAPVPIIAAGEGLETMMSLRMVLPGMPMIAALSANHLAALVLSGSTRRLYIAVDADPAGRGGMERLCLRARQLGLEVFTLMPQLGDFNEDLRRLGPVRLASGLRDQLAPDDAERFLVRI
jgi:hypothetical protein